MADQQINVGVNLKGTGGDQTAAEIRKPAVAVNEVKAALAQAAQAADQNLSHIDRASKAFIQGLELSSKGLQQVAVNAVKFSTSFIGFEVVQKALNTFSAATVGSAQAAAQFQSEMVEVGRVSGVTGKALTDLSNNFLDISRTTPIAADNLAKVADIVGKLGINGQQNIQSFTEAVSKLATVSDLSVDQLTTQLGRIAVVTQTPINQVNNLASALLVLGKSGASTEADITDAAERLAGAGKVLGISQADILGFANALTSLGVNSEAAGTSFSRVFIKISQAASGGGKALAEFGQVAGTTAEGFKAMVQNNPSQAVDAFIQGLAGIRETGGDVTKVLKDLGLSNIRVEDAILRSTNAANFFSDQLTIANKAFKDSNELQTEFNMISATSASKQQILANNFKDIQIEIGNAFLPSMAAASQSLSGFLRGLSNQEGGNDFGNSVRQPLTLLKQTVEGIAAPIRAVADQLKGLNVAADIGVQAIGGITTFAVLNGLLHLAGNTGIATSAFQKLGAAMRETAVEQGLLSAVIQRGDLVGYTTTTGPGFPNLVPGANRFRSVNGGTQFISDAQAAAEFQTGLRANTQYISPNQISQFQKQYPNIDLAGAFFPTSQTAVFDGTTTSLRNLVDQVGKLGAAKLILKSFADGLLSFATSAPGAITLIAGGIAGINAALEHFAGQGILEFFTTANEKAKAYQKTQDELNLSIAQFNREISTGEITTQQAGYQGIQSTLAGLVKNFQDLDAAQQNFKQSKNVFSNFIGDVTPFPGGRFIRNFFDRRGQREDIASLQGAVNGGENSLTQYAQQFNISSQQLANQKLLISPSLDPKTADNLRKTIDSVIKQVGEQEQSGFKVNLQFSQPSLDIQNALKSGEITSKQIQSVSDALTRATKNGQSASLAIKGITDNPKIQSFVGSILQWSDGISLTNTNVKILDSLIDEVLGKYPKLAEAAKQLIGSQQKQQQAELKVAEQQKPDVESTVQGLLNQHLTTDTSTKIQNFIQNQLDTGGSLSSIKSLNLPPEIINGWNDLYNAIHNGQSISDKELAALENRVKELTADQPELGQAIINAFNEAAKAVQSFTADLDGIKSAAKTIDLSNILDFGDFNEQNIQNALQKFNATAQSNLTGISIPLDLQMTINGNDLKSTAFSDYITQLMEPAFQNSFQQALLDMKVAPDSEVATNLQSQIQGAINAIASSGKSNEQMAKDLETVREILATYQELAKQGKITPEVQLYFDNTWQTEMARIRGDVSTPIFTDVDFNINSKAVTDFLDGLRNQPVIDIPVQLQFLGLGAQASAETIANQIPNYLFGGPGGVGSPNGLPDILGISSKIGQDLSNQNSQGNNSPWKTAYDNLVAEQKASADALGANTDAAKAANKQLTATDQNLLDIAKALKDLNITAEQFVEINKYTNLTGQELDSLAGVFQKLGVNISDLLPLMEKVNFDKIAKQLGITQQAIDTGTAQKFFQQLGGPGIFQNPDLLNAIAKLADALTYTQPGGQQVQGIQVLQDLLNGKLTADQIKRGVAPQAQGNIVKSSQLSLVGEAGPEVIIPLTKPDRAKELVEKSGLLDVIGVRKYADGGITDPFYQEQIAASQIDTERDRNAALQYLAALKKQGQQNFLGGPLQNLPGYQADVERRIAQQSSGLDLNQALLILSGQVPLTQKGAQGLEEAIRSGLTHREAAGSQRRGYILSVLSHQYGINLDPSYLNDQPDSHKNLFQATSQLFGPPLEELHNADVGIGEAAGAATSIGISKIPYISPAAPIAGAIVGQIARPSVVLSTVLAPEIDVGIGGAVVSKLLGEAATGAVQNVAFGALSEGQVSLKQIVENALVGAGANVALAGLGSLGGAVFKNTAPFISQTVSKVFDDLLLRDVGSGINIDLPELKPIADKAVRINPAKPIIDSLSPLLNDIRDPEELLAALQPDTVKRLETAITDEAGSSSGALATQLYKLRDIANSALNFSVSGAKLLHGAAGIGKLFGKAAFSRVGAGAAVGAILGATTSGSTTHDRLSGAVLGAIGGGSFGLTLGLGGGGGGEGPSLLERIFKKFLLGEEGKIGGSGRLPSIEGFTQIGDQLGSNPGAFFQSEYGLNKYFKFYSNPDQARAEALANEIYQALGVPVPWSGTQVAKTGELALGSEVLQGVAPLGDYLRESGKSFEDLSPTIKNGISRHFVADAYLANWDVLGQDFNNIMKSTGADGSVYRIDQGGALTFRAQGGKKYFDPLSIPELESLKDKNPEAFGSITHKDILNQANRVVDMLDKDMLRGMVSAHFPSNSAEGQDILSGLLGRLDYLKDLVGSSYPTTPRPISESLKGLTTLKRGGGGQIGDFISTGQGFWSALRRNFPKAARELESYTTASPHAGDVTGNMGMRKYLEEYVNIFRQNESLQAFVQSFTDQLPNNVTVFRGFRRSRYLSSSLRDIENVAADVSHALAFRDFYNSSGASIREGFVGRGVIPRDLIAGFGSVGEQELILDLTRSPNLLNKSIKDIMDIKNAVGSSSKEGKLFNSNDVNTWVDIKSKLQAFAQAKSMGFGKGSFEDIEQSLPPISDFAKFLKAFGKFDPFAPQTFVGSAEYDAIKSMNYGQLQSHFPEIFKEAFPHIDMNSKVITDMEERLKGLNSKPITDRIWGQVLNYFDGSDFNDGPAVQAITNALNESEWTTDNLEHYILPSTFKKIFPKGLAVGGIVTGPTQALIGEAGPEAVIPLDRFNSFMSRPRGFSPSSTSGQSSGQQTGVAINAPITIIGREDSTYNIAQRTVNGLNRFYQITNQRQRKMF